MYVFGLQMERLYCRYPQSSCFDSAGSNRFELTAHHCQAISAAAGLPETHQ